MAWNEPGGNRNDNDPWGSNNRGNKGGNNQGPPDLDEALKQLMDKLNGLFGSGPKELVALLAVQARVLVVYLFWH